MQNNGEPFPAEPFKTMSNLVIQLAARPGMAQVHPEKAHPLRGNGFPLSRQAFHARRLYLLHGGAGHRAAAVRERGHLLIHYQK